MRGAHEAGGGGGGGGEVLKGLLYGEDPPGTVNPLPFEIPSWG